MTTYKHLKRWRRENADARRRQQNRYRARTGSYNARRTNARWHPLEDYLALAHVAPDRDLAEIIGRSVTAIQVRRRQLVTREREDT